MRGFALFVAGAFFGLAVQFAVAQTGDRQIAGLNHVGLSVPDIDAALEYYTETLGFPEAFRVTNPNGEPRLIYIQLSQDTFVELQPANPQRPVGMSHFSLLVEDMDGAIRMFNQRGVNPSEVRVGSTNALISDITDLNGIRIELNELTPESLPLRAIQRWNSRP